MIHLDVLKVSGAVRLLHSHNVGEQVDDMLPESGRLSNPGAYSNSSKYKL